MSAIELLAQIIAQRVKISSASLRMAPGFGHLMQHGYLRDAGVVSSLACMDCDQAHDAEVVFDHGQYGYSCPDLGFIPVGRDEVQAVIPHIPKLIESLADAFQCKRRKASPLRAETWRIGAVDLGRGDAILFFQPSLRDAEDLHAFDDAQSREVRSAWRLIVTAEGASTVHGATAIRLCELVEMDEKDGRLVPMSGLGALLGIPSKNAGGAPNRFGEPLSAIIKARKRNHQTLTGVNKEARAVLAVFEREHPDLDPPSISSVKSYLSKIQGG
ncbi:MAG: hypothetical protein ABJH07_03150 [Sedimentitalea sp.]|uniref:hypothetical protein n=1 Tax=Sedimentitalea sp. TaxID=2048915 RepID=UPI003267770D